jgi:hypothetical protein
LQLPSEDELANELRREQELLVRGIDMSKEHQ